MDPLLAKLSAEENRRKDLIRELEQMATDDQVTSIDEARLKREIKARFADIKPLLGRHVSAARRLLRVLMEHPLRCEAMRSARTLPAKPAPTISQSNMGSPFQNPWGILAF